MLVEELKVKLTGDTSSLEGAFLRAGLKLEGFKVALEAVVDFAGDCVKAFAEQEKATAQLARVAGDATSAFEAQAEAIEKTLGVDSKKTMEVQRMLLQFGLAPAKVEGATRAVLDYAAATGEDAAAATKHLITGVEKGSGVIRDMGINFDTTGTKGQALASAVDSLGERFGGAAAANAATLSGRMAILASYWDDLKKGFGGFIAAIEQKYEILKKLADVFQTISDNMGRAGKDQLLSRKINLQKDIDLQKQNIDDYEKTFGRFDKGVMTLTQNLWKMQAEMNDINAQLGAVAPEAVGKWKSLGTQDKGRALIPKELPDQSKELGEGFKYITQEIEEMADAADAVAKREKNRAAEAASMAAMLARVQNGAMQGGQLATLMPPLGPKLEKKESKNWITELYEALARPLTDENGKWIATMGQVFGKIGAGIALSGLSLVQRLGDFGKVASAALQGFQAGGWIGAIVAVIAEIISMAKGFEMFQQANDKLMKTLVAVMNDSGLGELFKVLTADVLTQMKVFTPIFRFVGQIFGQLAKIMNLAIPFFAITAIMLELLMKPLGFIINAIGEALKFVLGFIFPIIFDIGKSVFMTILAVAGAVVDIWNSIIVALSDIFSMIVATITGGAVQGAGDFLKSLLIGTSGITEAIDKLKDTTWDSAIDAAMNLADSQNKAADAANRFSESLTNVPSGFRVAAARYNATAAVGGGTFGPGNFTGFGSKGTIVKVYIDSKEVAAATSETMAENEGREYGGKSGRWGDR